MVARPKQPQDRPRGRPSSYKPEFVSQAEQLCRLGATDEELANFFAVHVATIYRWQTSHQEFCEALKVGKEEADARVERSLFHRAVGFKHEAVKIFMPAGATEPVYAPFVEHVAPDTTACIFWLKNRKPEEWRDRQELEHSGKIGIATELSDAELSAIAAAGHAATGRK